MPLTVVLFTIAVGALAFRARQRQGYGPFALGVLASAIVIIGKFILGANIVVYLGAILMVAASVWNVWPRRLVATADNSQRGRCGCQA